MVSQTVCRDWSAKYLKIAAVKIKRVKQQHRAYKNHSISCPKDIYKVELFRRRDIMIVRVMMGRVMRKRRMMLQVMRIAVMRKSLLGDREPTDSMLLIDDHYQQVIKVNHTNLTSI